MLNSNALETAEKIKALQRENKYYETNKDMHSYEKKLNMMSSIIPAVLGGGAYLGGRALMKAKQNVKKPTRKSAIRKKGNPSIRGGRPYWD